MTTDSIRAPTATPRATPSVRTRIIPTNTQEPMLRYRSPKSYTP